MNEFAAWLICGGGGGVLVISTWLILRFISHVLFGDGWEDRSIERLDD